MALANDQPMSFEEFLQGLRDEIKASGDDLDFTEEEAREMFDMVSSNNHEEDTSGMQEEHQFETTDAEIVNDEEKDDEEVLQMLRELGLDENEALSQLKEHTEDDVNEGPGYEQDIIRLLQEQEGSDDGDDPVDILERMSMSEDGDTVSTTTNREVALSEVEEEEAVDPVVAELQQVLPGMPVSRLKKVAKAFRQNLGYPSLLTLTPLLRENMPEHITAGYLKRKNVQNAYFTMQQAKEEGVVNTQFMNGVLQVETASGNIERALACHEAQFKLNNLTPTQYSDRLVLQMLIKKNSLSRALQFKERVEKEGRTLDILSYGSFIDHYGKHKQVGSAMMMLNECVRIHKSAPNERSLSRLRLVCRQQNLSKELAELAGEDPLKWLREGEGKHKREMSKRGRRDINVAINKSVHI